tara:strand:+ start:304 stop:582 length:279 start_codon:yes stop_codon:yes gene_type:complete
MFLLFPIYQLITFFGIWAIISSFKAVGATFYFLPLAITLVILIGIPVFASWHLSVLLFSVGYFEFFAWLGFPLMGRVTRHLIDTVNWFRPEH